MLEQKAMKIIAPARCPHCEQEIIISQNLVVPVIGWVLKKKDIEAAKAKVRNSISESNLPETEKTDIYRWLDNPDTMFGPEEINTLLEQLNPEQAEEKHPDAAN